MGGGAFGLALAASVLAGTPAPAEAQGATRAGIQAEDGFIPEPPHGARSAAGYVVLINDGPRARTLVGVRTPAAADAGIHTMSMSGGVMRMRASGPLSLPAHSRTDLGPSSGRHLMFTGLKAPLKSGDEVPIAFDFASGPSVRAVLRVRTRAPGA